jgi:hypothetical protein
MDEEEFVVYPENWIKNCLSLSQTLWIKWVQNYWKLNKIVTCDYYSGLKGKFKQIHPSTEQLNNSLPHLCQLSLFTATQYVSALTEPSSGDTHDRMRSLKKIKEMFALVILASPMIIQDGIIE